MGICALSKQADPNMTPTTIQTERLADFTTPEARRSELEEFSSQAADAFVALKDNASTWTRLVKAESTPAR